MDKLEDIVNENTNAYHSTIKMKAGNLKASTYINFAVENNEKRSPTSEAGDHVKILK